MRIKAIQFFLLISFLLFFSCNNNDEGAGNGSAASPVTPAQLMLLHNKFPDSLTLTEKLIENFRDKGNYDSALIITGAELKKDSMNAGFWDIKATLHFENGDSISAMHALENAVNIYPLPEYIISLGSLYAQLKNPKALVMADALISADKAKANREAIFIKGLYYSYAGDKKQAINYFDSCIRMDYTYMFAYREKAIALYDQLKYEEALKVLAKAVTIQNSFDEGYYWMGKCYQKLNRKNEAIQNYQTALLYDKDFSEARDSLNKLEGK